MSIKGRDKEFRCTKVSFLEFKHMDMDRLLTMLFPRLKFDGHGNRLLRRKLLTIKDFRDEFIDKKDWFEGFQDHPDIVYKWLETDLLDLVNRGKDGQAVAAPRPLHGNTYKFRNTKFARDFSGSEQVYWMLYYARHGKGQAVRDALKRFFFHGYDFLTDKYDQNAVLDVETQALLRLDHQVERDTKDSRDPDRQPPVCIGRTDIFADDILRLLAYENHIPRSVLVEYLKTLIAFHLSLYHMELLELIPGFVKHEGCNAQCDRQTCPIKENLKECPYRHFFVTDMGSPDNAHLTAMAEQSAEKVYRKIPAFVAANYKIKKLDELAEYLQKTHKLSPSQGNEFSLNEIISLSSGPHAAEKEAYFKFRLTKLVEEATEKSEIVDPEIRSAVKMDLDDFDTFIEILMAYRGKYHRQYITECLDSILLKNKDNGLLVQPTRKKRRFVLGSKLLELLLQLAVLTQKENAFVTRELQIEELLVFLYERYGICIDRIPTSSQGSSILEKRALRLNLEAFKRRLRDIGFYEDLSDAYITQKITPRYQITRAGQSNSNGGQA
ncbi:MAG: hypothetical protein KKE62_16075 [Proteobacteria bacterium]|nr:hypothetical protein [Pseudomonadota bacterium]MBU1387902.1 hypothetical protein [Pseudomonadota bacterium]MBU1544348.1 hypothetical protein [Pseudomonadota bacterium]MBU2429376.1 hypothetical protein [Pseudomonadota bacterium]